ncbi:MAG: nucleotidyl transferase AbiEii/AbiGii toxin family protein [Gammaproteobacteria bacterium]|nr:nucleotidyl transferase AbiEii/AbiGii toxin family protein [Gammaproteobacteria bacterium]
MYKRLHHQYIARVLDSLNAPLLSDNHCLFGGGTAITLCFGEYRESVDIDFLVSDIRCYRNLRQLMTSPSGITAILREDAEKLEQSRPVRADQYGIRTMLLVDNYPIKFEIILEGRIQLESPDPRNKICGITILTLLDMVTSKLLANSDRWPDDAVFGRDLVDLAMMEPDQKLMQAAIVKAEVAYGHSIRRDLNKAIDRMQTEDGWMERCIHALSIEIPKALLWQKVRALRSPIF